MSGQVVLFTRAKEDGFVEVVSVLAGFSPTPNWRWGHAKRSA
jgi:hypothetical protein